MGSVRAKITAMKLPRQYPFVLLVNMGWIGGNSFDCEEGIDERWSRERTGAGFHSKPKLV
jgi:hypothetical protein